MNPPPLGKCWLRACEVHLYISRTNCGSTKYCNHFSAISLSSVPWSIRPLTTHDVFIFKVRFLAASHMVRGDVSPVFSITWLRKRSLCPPLAFFPSFRQSTTLQSTCNFFKITAANFRCAHTPWLPYSCALALG